ncbi:nucleotide-binding domain containing protein, partial [Escherichia coli]|nr:hypothetical protein [Escherichia coli]
EASHSSDGSTLKLALMTISPGVPWVNALDKPVSLALKSGNFGDDAFFSRAQREFLS